MNSQVAEIFVLHDNSLCLNDNFQGIPGHQRMPKPDLINFLISYGCCQSEIECSLATGNILESFPHFLAFFLGYDYGRRQWSRVRLHMQKGLHDLACAEKLTFLFFQNFFKFGEIKTRDINIEKNRRCFDPKYRCLVE